jgi:hypothetical protein
MVATTAKDMPRTVREVRACKGMLADDYGPRFGKEGSEMPPWPTLKARKQRA